MPEIDQKAMKFVEDTLEKSPTIQLEELFRRTQEVRPSIARLTKRQFNARYPLQVKRRRALAARGGSAGQKRLSRAKARAGGVASAPPQEAREAVRRVLLRFATDIAGAEERKDLVKVLAGVDHYVDQVLKGVAKA